VRGQAAGLSVLPIRVADWTVADLRWKIGKVRARYLETLADRPAAAPGGRSGRAP